MRKVVVLLVVLLATLLAACQSNTTSNSSSEIVYGLTLEPSGIDPHLNASAELGIPLRSVYDTLVYYDTDTDDYVPGLAESWQINNGQEYIFQLRQDVFFHDGERFNAEAARINFERILNPANNSAKAAGLLGPVSSVDAMDEYTLRIALSAPFPALLDGLSQPYLGMASPVALAEYTNETYQFNQVGTGPYRFVEYSVGNRIVLERYDDYTPVTPAFTLSEDRPERIVFRFYTNPSSRAIALRSGDAQIMGELLPSDARDLQESGDATIQQVPIPGQPQQLFFNTQQPPTTLISVRRALLFATDRQSIAQTVFQGYRPIAYGPLSSSTRFFSDTVTGRFAYDPSQAVSTMDSTGYIDSDGDGIRDNAGEPITIDVVIPPWGLNPEVAIILEQQWESTLEIEVNINEVPSFPALLDAAESGDYNLIGLNFFGNSPVILNDFYLTDGFFNLAGVQDSNVDNFLIAAQSETVDSARTELYSQAQQLILEQASVLPLTEYVNLIGTAPEISGLRFDGQGWFPYLAEVSVAGQ